MQPVFYFEQGLVIERQGRVLEFQHRTDTCCYFEDPRTRDVVPITEAEFWDEFAREELRVLPARSTPTELELPKPDEESRPLPVLSENHEKIHARKLRYIREIEQRGITRGQVELIEEAIPEIAKENKDLELKEDPKPPAAMTVTEWMRKLDRAHGDVSVLLPASAWKLTRQRQTPEHEELLENLVEGHFTGFGEGSATDIHSDKYPPALASLNAELAQAGKPVVKKISLRSFSRRTEKIDRFDLAVMRYGYQEARRRFRMAKSHMPATYPLAYVEIDHAQLRLWVVDDKLGLPLGRPWVTVVRDRYSGMVLGFYVSFRGPSLASTFAAIRHSLHYHGDLNKTFPDLEHSWVAFGRGTTYVSDRGLDFLSPRYRTAILQLGSYFNYCESRTPWHKPNIERIFLTIFSDLLETMPGQVFKGLSYHRDYNPREDAVVRFSTLTYLLVKWAVDLHPYKPNRYRQARPIDLWLDGTGDAPPGYLPNVDSLNIVLGARHLGTMDSEGIRYRHLTWTDDGLHSLFNAIDKKKLHFVINEENLGRIHVENPRDRIWFQVNCTRPDYAEGLSAFQHQQIVRQANAELERITSVDQLMQVRLHIREKIAEDLARKESGAKQKIARYCGIDSTSVFAGNAKSVIDLLPQAQSADSRSSLSVRADGKLKIPDVPFTDVPIFAWGA